MALYENGEEIKSEAGGLDSMELEELIQYVNGTRSETPAVLDKIMTNLYTKMLTVSGYSVATEVARQAKLTSFLAKVEEELFDEHTISTMSHEDLMDMHDRLSRETSKSREETRRWISQNRDILESKKMTEIEQLAAKITALPTDKVAQIRAILEGATAEEPVNPDAAPFDDF